jgi:hypothetical protein
MNQDIVSRVMREMGKKGGKAGGPKGGKARMDSLTTDERKKLGRKAAAARWRGHEKEKGKAGS